MGSSRYKVSANKKKVEDIFKKNNFDLVLNFAAQAGVRYSYENPKSYTDSNIIGFINLVDIIKNFKIKRFIFASSSSVYGLNKRMPYREDHKCDNPSSLYAASKKMKKDSPSGV